MKLLNLRRLLCCIAIFATATLVQAGPSAVPDSPTDLPKETAEPVPLLSADEAIKSISLPPGFKLETVAEEPMIEHPIAMSFDADGRMWIVEMRSYMPDVEGKGENAPTGRITVLDDTDGDGRADKVTVFMDKLVLPRAVLPTRGGALVAVPPYVWFCRDTDGDGMADEKTIVAEDYGLNGNPEHQPNGLVPNIDNWIYNANYGGRFRFLSGAWQRESVPELGQWGMSQDNAGRLFHNNNSDYLRTSLFATHYADRNPDFRSLAINYQTAPNQTVWPGHKTALDRGYLPKFVRDDGTLQIFTAACAPLIYRGGTFPPEYEGNAFVCEPSANFIRRSILTQKPEGQIVSRNAYDEKQSEFLISTYERFRPVNLSLGPDGAVYVIDMHHGLLQHQVYLTTYCKDLYLAKELQKHMESGRIYRLVPEHPERTYDKPNLSKASTADLIAALSHANGWWRDMAQRQIVERNDFRALPALRKLARTGENPLGRLHALWTLEGLRVSDPNVILPALRDPDPLVRAAAIRLTEPFITSPTLGAKAAEAVLSMAGDDDPTVMLQFAVTVSTISTPAAEHAMANLIEKHPNSLPLRDAVLTGLRGRETEFVSELVDSGHLDQRTDGARLILTALGQCVLKEKRPTNVSKLLDTIARRATRAEWQSKALLEAFPKTRAADEPERRGIMLAGEPTAFLSLKNTASQDLVTPIENAYALIHWPGQPGYVEPPPPRPLTADETARFERGQKIFSMTCVQCHKEDGQGLDGLAPPLVDSEWALGPEGRMIRIVLGGLQGPINVDGKKHSLEMPSLQALSDEDIAGALTYVRRNWGNTANPVTPDVVKRVRAETASRKVPWTERELLKVE